MRPRTRPRGGRTGGGRDGRTLLPRAGGVRQGRRAVGLPRSALPLATAGGRACPFPVLSSEAKGGAVGSVIKKRRKRMAKKKHRKLLKKTRIQRRNKK